jgi:glycosyltransferase involved in cell wall biosynthesis
LRCGLLIGEPPKDFKMSSCLVSIAVPAYRQPELLQRALQSVAEQTYRDFEVIITDDSPDDSVEQVAGKFARSFPVSYFRNANRLGSPENWNEALRHSRGELVKMLHHDDWFPDENCLKEFVEMMKTKPQAALGFGSTWVCNAKTGSRHLHTVGEQLLNTIRRNPKVLFFGNWIGAPSATVFRRVDFAGFDPKLKWLVDVEFYLRMLANKPYLAYSDKPLICTTDGADHQVTSGCLGIKEVEAYEWLYLYGCLDHGGWPSFKRLRFVAWVFRKLGIRSPQELKPYVRDLRIPPALRGWMWLRLFLRGKAGGSG